MIGFLMLSFTFLLAASLFIQANQQRARGKTLSVSLNFFMPGLRYD